MGYPSRTLDAIEQKDRPPQHWEEAIIAQLMEKTRSKDVIWFKIDLSPNFFFFVTHHKGLEYRIYSDTSSYGDLAIVLLDSFGQQVLGRGEAFKNPKVQDLRDLISSHNPQTHHTMSRFFPHDRRSLIELAVVQLNSRL